MPVSGKPATSPTAATAARTASPLSLAVLGLGVFLLVLAPLLAWYVTPRAKVTPIDVDVTTVFTGNGSYFDTAALKTRDQRRITITRHVLGDVAASEKSGRAVWDVSTTVDTPQTLPLKDPRRAFQWTTERWVTDRRSNAPVHCCEEAPTRFDGDAYLKFPFDVRKTGYRWWDNTLGAAVPLRFAGTQRVQGYPGYRFTGTVPPTRTGSRQVPGRLVGRPGQGQIQAEEWYANSGIELVVEPRTGRIMQAVLSPLKTLRAPGARRTAVTLLRGERLQFTPATQRAQVRLAKADSDKLALVGRTLPVTAAAAGGLLAPAGVVWVVRGRRATGRS
ncbi:DUF3068 domain-containing protein [Streptomyces sp. Isolate_219]|uniref:DUF3068 domain-containing protein n=1 Tax=Streptomyces sp. Isolate_219 TaxID=2950110 RepID=UPI0021C840D8|nr:DUF3068 domain-containing protein [Streptomyces sp. Isolate_219]MCR8573025.1 DUF3068 domain-containing protein [Streptomyces sp. Isolate_219]